MTHNINRPTSWPRDQRELILAQRTELIELITLPETERQSDAANLQLPLDTPGRPSETTEVSQTTRTIASGDIYNGDDFIRRTKEVDVTPSPDRTVNRHLGGLAQFMITINATLGTGLYWRGGQILELGGPLAVPLSFLSVGILTWAVMQCITEMLCIWPIPGALSVYVREFVDPELGIAVGVAYWFTWSVGFSALIAIIAAEFHFWVIVDNPAFDTAMVYFGIPFILVIVNHFRIKTYGWIEVLVGSIKITALVILCGFALKPATTGSEPAGIKRAGHEDWQSPFAYYDQKACTNWVSCFFISLPIATFAYAGVEVVAASAIEAKWPTRTDERVPTDLSQRSSEELLIGRTVKFAAAYVSVVVTSAYTVVGTLATLVIAPVDPRLPQLSWASDKANATSLQETDRGNTTSVFVAIAQDMTEIPHLADVFNAFILFAAVTCANTNLYVSSRSLFGLTTRLDGGPNEPLLLRFLALLGRTNDRKVPVRAIWFSALAFFWVPFLELKKKNESINMFIEILTSMSSLSVVIVWACNCLAFIRYYNCIYRHRRALEEHEIPHVQRWSREHPKDYPYRSYGQPYLAVAAFLGCLFILLGTGGASFTNGFKMMPFLASYLIVFAFTALWIILKLARGARFRGATAWFVDLDNEDVVLDKMRRLHGIRVGAS